MKDAGWSLKMLEDSAEEYMSDGDLMECLCESVDLYHGEKPTLSFTLRWIIFESLKFCHHC
jgi:hypothetical protein